MEISIREKMQQMEDKLSANDQELVALHAACDDYKAQNEALTTTIEEVKKDLEAKVAEASESEENFESEMQEKDEEIAVLAEQIEEMKAKMELTPVAEATDGQEPVEDGSVSTDEVDHVAECEKLSGAEKIAYYRAHKEEIDKAYA